MTMKIYLALIGLLVVGGATGVWLTQSENVANNSQGSHSSPRAVVDDFRGQTEAPSNIEIPDIQLQDFEGNVVELAQLTGKPLVLNTWATWCPFCVDELPDLATVQEEFGDEVTIVAINRSETLRTAQEYTSDLGLDGSLVFLLDGSDRFYREIGGFSMPETLFINSDGSIHFHKRGVMTIDEIRQRVKALIAAQ